MRHPVTFESGACEEQATAAEARLEAAPLYAWRGLTLYCGELLLGTLLALPAWLLTLELAPLAADHYYRLGAVPSWLAHNPGLLQIVVSIRLHFLVVGCLAAPFRRAHAWTVPRYRRPIPLSGFELVNGAIALLGWHLSQPLFY